MGVAAVPALAGALLPQAATTIDKTTRHAVAVEWRGRITIGSLLGLTPCRSVIRVMSANGRRYLVGSAYLRSEAVGQVALL